MSLVRFRVACRGQIELHEVSATDVEIGRDEGADLRIDHPSVALRHARVLLRRGRLLLVHLGAAPTRTGRGDGRILAPLILKPRESFELGDVTVSAWLASDEDRSWVGRSIFGGLVAVEREPVHRQVRRYQLERPDGSPAELLVTRSSLPRAQGDRWLARLSGGATADVASSAGWIDGRACLVEAITPGVRLDVFASAIQKGAVRVALDTLLVIVALLAEHVERSAELIGAHGALDPRAIQLGREGSVRLLHPGPSLEGAEIDDALIAPERRFGGAATVAGDVFALGALGKSLLEGMGDVPPRVRAVLSWLAHVDPMCRPIALCRVADELRAIAQTLGRDATSLLVARAVHVLLPARPRLAAVAGTA